MALLPFFSSFLLFVSFIFYCFPFLLHKFSGFYFSTTPSVISNEFLFYVTIFPVPNFTSQYFLPFFLIFLFFISSLKIYPQIKFLKIFSLGSFFCLFHLFLLFPLNLLKTLFIFFSSRLLFFFLFVSLLLFRPPFISLNQICTLSFCCSLSLFFVVFLLFLLQLFGLVKFFFFFFIFPSGFYFFFAVNFKYLFFFYLFFLRLLIPNRK